MLRKIFFLQFLVFSLVGYAQNLSDYETDAALMAKIVETATHFTEKQSAQQTSDEQQIRDLFLKYAEAMRNADVKTVAGLYTNDATTEFQGKNTVNGVDAIAKGYTETFQHFDLRNITYPISTLEVSENMAIVRTYHPKGSYVWNKDVDKAVSDLNRELFVLKKTAEGWKIAIRSYNQMAKPEGI